MEGFADAKRPFVAATEYHVNRNYSLDPTSSLPRPHFLHFINGGVGARGWKNWDDVEARFGPLPSKASDPAIVRRQSSSPARVMGPRPAGAPQPTQSVRMDRQDSLSVVSGSTKNGRELNVPSFLRPLQALYRGVVPLDLRIRWHDTVLMPLSGWVRRRR
jgi:hypothetical protein